ncbi:hypothetical protein HA402_001044, partial [Bradysia odoriphaga]
TGVHYDDKLKGSHTTAALDNIVSGSNVNDIAADFDDKLKSSHTMTLDNIVVGPNMK